MTETQKRIKAYQKALPSMKERVMAVALLLVMSISMMTSATFAWITLSRAPEVNSMTTTIATNGNLEIALSDVDGLEPDETAVGDGGKAVTLSNLTWGNLINLSDSSYGLSNIVLRPASLNNKNLATNPMYAVKYGADGRISGYLNEFSFTSFDDSVKDFVVAKRVLEDGTVEYVTEYGVRAVSTVTYKDLQGDLFILDQLDLINDKYNAARDKFVGIYQSETYMACVGGLVGQHASYILSWEDQSCKEYYPNLVELTKAFKDCMEAVGDAIVEIANLYYYCSLLDTTVYESTKFTRNDLTDSTSARYADMTKYIKDHSMTSITEFRTGWANTVSAYNGITVEAKQVYDSTGDVLWHAHLQAHANKLCNMDTATLNGMNAAQLKSAIKAALGSGLSGMGQVYELLDDPVAVINGGAIYSADKLIDGEMFVPRSDNIVIRVTYSGIPMEVKPTIETSAEEPFLLPTDMDAAETAALTGGTASKGEPVAAETYAMAVDVWVRTNSTDSYLILEGEVITEEVEVLDADGNVIMVPVLDENGNPQEDADGNTITEPLMEEVAVGYEGVNRVWEEMDDPNFTGGMIPDDGIIATQGSGSCYIFYPASPEDQAQSLKLLGAMCVAFVDEEGNLLAQADMDVSNAVEDAGRVIVPLQLRPKRVVVGTKTEIVQEPVLDENGDPVLDANGNETYTEKEQTVEIEEVSYHIMELKQNQAERITAIVYLNGTNLSNSDVLAAGSISGQLNIQFGTSDMELDAWQNEDVMDNYYTIHFDDTEFEFEEDATDWTVDLALSISGTEPSRVEGNFISVISATQGARQDTFTMTYNAESEKWEATVPFSGPGNYQLRSIRIDGVDFALDEDNIVKVVIPGLNVRSLFWNDSDTDPSNVRQVLTAESQCHKKLALTLNSSAETIHTVQGVFMGDNGQNVTVNFTSSNGTNYEGTATFSASGTYELTYVLIDGNYTAIDPDLYKSIDVNLGLYAEIFLSEPYFTDEDMTEEEYREILREGPTFNAATGWSFVYTCAQPLNFDVQCNIYDDQNKKITTLESVELNYGTESVRDMFDPTLTWDSTEGVYKGTFPFQTVGQFKFQTVIVNRSNYVTKATLAPTITSISPDPVEYVGKVSGHQDRIFALGSTNRNISLALDHAAAANVEFILESPQGETVILLAGTPVTTGDRSVFTVNVSNAVNSDGNKLAQYDGVWTIVGARASSVFYDGVFYDGGTDEGSTGWLNLTGFVEAEADQGEVISTEFITQVNVAVNKTGTVAFEPSAFMAEQTLDGMVLTFTDYDGRPITQFADTALTVSANGLYTHGKFSDYVTMSEDKKPDAISVTGGGTINANSQITLDVAKFAVDGTYTCTNGLSVEIKDASGNVLRANPAMPSVKVTWIAPSVTISAITPTGSFNVDTTGAGSGHAAAPTNTTNPAQNMAPGIYKYEGDTLVRSTTDGTVAWVYFKCTTYSSYHIYIADAGYGGYGNPTVTLKLNGITGYNSASLKFNDETRIYNAVTYTTSGFYGSWETQNPTPYTWNSSTTTATRYIGYGKGSKGRLTDRPSATGSKTPAGTITANELTVTHSTGTYVFTIPTVTINNPY